MIGWILLFINGMFGSNIGTSFLKDKDFQEKFVAQYGQVYFILKDQIQAWVDVLGYKSLSLKDLEIISNMAIPDQQKKKFFKILESIVIKLDQVNVVAKDKPLVKNKRDQLMIKIYNRYKKFYNPQSMMWHLKHGPIKNNKNPLIYEGEKNLPQRLAHYLVYRSILTEKNFQYFNRHWSLFFKEPIQWTPVIYGLILSNINNHKKLSQMGHYPMTIHQKNFIEFLKINSKVNLINLINQYKKTCCAHGHQSHEILILLIKYIVNNRKNTAISNKEWIHIFKIIVSYYPLILKDFKGVGLAYFCKAMKILMYKQIRILFLHRIFL